MEVVPPPPPSNDKCLKCELPLSIHCETATIDFGSQESSETAMAPAKPETPLSKFGTFNSLTSSVAPTSMDDYVFKAATPWYRKVSATSMVLAIGGVVIGAVFIIGAVSFVDEMQTRSSVMRFI